jgi:hypothetical protein
MRQFIILITCLLVAVPAWAASDSFPAYVAAPAYTSYFADSTPNNVYHISPSGSDSTGTGTYATPWASLAGAQGTAAAGDLILFHEGTYTSYTNGASSWYSTNRLTTPGTSSDRIVILAANKYTGYSSETQPLIDIKEYLGMTLYAYQVLDGLKIDGGLSIYANGVVVQNCDFSGACAAQQDGNPACILFPAESPCAQNITIRNNKFHDPENDHTAGNGRAYAIIMFDSNLDSIEGAWNGGYTRIWYNQFYNWDAPTSQKFIVYQKDSAHGLDVAYNRFFNSNAFALAGYGQSTVAYTRGCSYHHNLAYNCDGLAFWWGYGYGDSSWHDNVVIDNGYSDTAYYMAGAAGDSFGMVGVSNHDCATLWGAVYNNIFYVDDPGEWASGTDATGSGYWAWVDYNAYASTSGQSAFENANSGSANWQVHDQTSQQTVTVDGSYFATVADSYPYKTSGRYSDCIGGFAWSGGGSSAGKTMSGGVVSGGTLR